MSTLHSSVGSAFGHMLGAMFKADFLSEREFDSLHNTRESICSAFEGEYDGSAKKADYSLTVEGGDVNPVFVVEAGVSQSYRQLKRDAKLWLLGTQNSEDGEVMTMIIVKITRKPMTPEDPTASHLEEFNDSSMEELEKAIDPPEGYTGPSYQELIQDFPLAAFMELWRSNPEDPDGMSLEKRIVSFTLSYPITSMLTRNSSEFPPG
jgi:hypothetical protein